jgi:hypothetical protein
MERETPELLFADDARYGLPGDPALDKCKDPGNVRFADGPIGMGDEPGGIEAKGVADEEAGVEVSGGEAIVFGEGALQPLRSTPVKGANCLATDSIPADSFADPPHAISAASRLA